MLKFILLMVAAGAVAQTEDKIPMYPYVQATTAFARARLFLQERLPDKPIEINEPEDRKHFNYGILAGATMNLVKAFYSTDDVYEPLKVLQESVPTAWEDYNTVARKINDILAEVQSKIQPITSLINKLCTETTSVGACNFAIEEYILHASRPYMFYRDRAKCLLKLGKASRILNRQAGILDDITAADSAVPYLLKLADNTAYEVFIAELTRVYEYLRPRKFPNAYE